MNSSFLKDASEGTSASEAGTEFHRGTFQGNKLNLKKSQRMLRIVQTIREHNWMMLHTKYKGSLSCGFKKKRFFFKSFRDSILRIRPSYATDWITIKGYIDFAGEG